MGFVHEIEGDLRRELRRSRRRERLLMAVFVIEVVGLCVGYFWRH
jgi:hypothetical protein